jgi:ubiquinone/menaquinone biosynthesis C-methylase UbiE
VGHYEEVSRAFDQAAGTYDEVYQGNAMMAWMRTESLGVLSEVFRPGGHLLEIGCGTGEEALALGRRGHRVVATDISPAMIDVARAKAQKTKGQAEIEWRVLPGGCLPALVEDYGEGAFDGAYASFGALNCEPHLEEAVAGLVCLLRPGAPFVCSVMNRWCAWEMMWGLAHLRPGEAFRRLRPGWTGAGLAGPDGRLEVPTRYYALQELVQAFSPHFRVRLVRGLPVVLPPPYLARLWGRFPRVFVRLESVERMVRDRFPFNRLGDHALVVLERETGASAA